MMTYKLLTTNRDGIKIYAKIEDNGNYRITCSEQDPEFQTHIKAGAELQSAEGQVMSQEEANQFIATLP